MDEKINEFFLLFIGYVQNKVGKNNPSRVVKSYHLNSFMHSKYPLENDRLSSKIYFHDILKSGVS